MGRDATFAVVDIGSTKIATLIASKNEHEDLTILGCGSVPVEDIFRKGILCNVERASRALALSISAAEEEANLKVGSLTVGFSGEHLRSFNSSGAVPISKVANQITENEVEAVIAAAQAVSLPFEREILHVLPQEFFIDQGDPVKDPIGNSGVRLEVQVHIVTASTQATQAIYKTVQAAGYEITSLVANPIVIGSALLNSEEEEIGTLLLDIGGSTSDIAVYYKGAIRHTASIGLGGKYVTNDIAVGLQIPQNLAEKIKIASGHAFSADIDAGEMIEIPEMGGRKQARVSRVLLASIIEARMEEILELARTAALRSGFAKKLSCGVILTGGGAHLRGVDKLAQKIFALPVKVGYPEKVRLPEDYYAKPEYSTAIGLLAYGLRHPVEHEEKKNIFVRMYHKVEDVISAIFNI